MSGMTGWLRERVGWLVAGGAAITLLSGCAALPKGPELPIGHWVGEGRFATVWWNDATDPTLDNAFQRVGEYKTSFVAAAVEKDGEPMTRVEVISQRGPLHEDDDSDRTHLVLYLAKRRLLTETVSVWGVASWALSLEAGEPEPVADQPTPVDASCMRLPSGIMFQVNYLEGFSDNWWFAGDSLYKCGGYQPVDDDAAAGFVHWAERLERQSR